MYFNITNEDWKLFKEKLPVWQETHMARLNSEYIELLSENANASEKFWQLEKRIRNDKKSAGVITEMSRRNVIPCILKLLL